MITFTAQQIPSKLFGIYSIFHFLRTLFIFVSRYSILLSFCASACWYESSLTIQCAVISGLHPYRLPQLTANRAAKLATDCTCVWVSVSIEAANLKLSMPHEASGRHQSRGQSMCSRQLALKETDYKMGADPVMLLFVCLYCPTFLINKLAEKIGSYSGLQDLRLGNVIVIRRVIELYK